MLNTILDYNLFGHFTENQPQLVPIGTEIDNTSWLTMWEYLKSGSNVSIINYQNQQNVFLNSLTTGRKGTTCRLDSVFKKPHKNILPKNQNIKSVFLLDVPNEIERKKYRANNGLLFGFKEDYKKVWRDIAILEVQEVLSVRKRGINKFHSWKQLSNYILPYTDLIIVDNYMFDGTVWEYNLFKIIEEYSIKTPVKFNLTLVSFSDNRAPLNIVDLNSKLTQFLSSRGIKCNLSIILAPQQIKEHDRGIFSNYLRIKSGDSFNYFDKNGEIITRGTDIDFHTMVKVDKVNAADSALMDIRSIIDSLKRYPNKESRLLGNLKNNLLDIE